MRQATGLCGGGAHVDRDADRILRLWAPRTVFLVLVCVCVLFWESHSFQIGDLHHNPTV